MNKLAIFAFLVGAAVGSVATWKIVEKKYQTLAEEEINSVREFYISKEKKEQFEVGAKNTALSAINQEKPSVKEYAEKIQGNNYTSYNEIAAETPPDPTEEPYVISPEEFGEYDDYPRITLYYYSDQILTDDNHDIIHDVDRLIGWDSLTHFGEYEDDSVYVRNDHLKRDFEVLRCLERYDEYLERNPYKAEVQWKDME